MITKKMKQAFNWSEDYLHVIRSLKFYYAVEEMKHSEKKEERVESAKEDTMRDILLNILSDSNKITEKSFIKNRFFFQSNDGAFLSSNNLIDAEDSKEGGFMNLDRMDAFLDLTVLFQDKSLEINKKAHDIIEKYCPKNYHSDFYKLLFQIVLLFLCSIQMDAIKAKKRILNVNEFENLSEKLNSLENGKIITELLQIVLYQNKLEEKEKIVTSLLKEYLQRSVREIISGKKWMLEDFDYITLVLQLFVFVQLLYNSKADKSEVVQIAITCAALKAADECYNMCFYKAGICFANIALNSDEEADRLQAFNILGLCAIDSVQYQLAYDVFLSWITKGIVFNFSENIIEPEKFMKEINEKLNSDKEVKWRKKEKHKVATMYGNFAYVCGKMYDLIEEGEYHDILVSLAQHYIVLAIGLNPQSSAYYCSAGTIFSDADQIDKSMQYYEKYIELAGGMTEKLTASRSMIITFLDLHKKNRELSPEEYERMNFLLKEYVENYRKAERIIYINRELKEEVLAGKKIYNLISEINKLDNNIKEIQLSILQISNIAGNILRRLRQTSYLEYSFDLHIELLIEEVGNSIKINVTKLKREEQQKNKEKQKNTEIAYYTTLKNAQYLWNTKEENIENKNTDSIHNRPKNCFTLMHARHMNDPEEGLVLLDKLSQKLPEAPIKLRDALYDKKFVFLKSFTGLIDQLNMWTMYGSDRKSGKDSNGCCICIAPETFHMVVNKVGRNQDTSAQLSVNEEDDFHLYSVAYMDGVNIFVNGKRDRILEKYFKLLEKNLEKVCRVKKLSDRDRNTVSRCLVYALEKPMFLFKDISYHLEAERRLIITRDMKDKDEISSTEKLPPKLFINPQFQVFPEKIILGPKVEESDNWIPYLQYELAKIGEKWPSSCERKFNPVVRKSRINIR